MAIKTDKVSNCAVYIDGESFLGQAEEMTCPDVAPKMIDHKGLGLIGEIELATTGIQKMTAKVKWNSVNLVALKKVLDPFTAVRLQVRANVEKYEGQSKVADVPCVIMMTAVAKKVGGANFKPLDNVENETEFNVTAYSMEIDDQELIYVDVLANIWRVNGVDLLQKFRQNIGQA